MALNLPLFRDEIAWFVWKSGYYKSKFFFKKNSDDSLRFEEKFKDLLKG